MTGGRRINLFYPETRRTRRYSPYVRTLKRPFVWTPNCHRKFVEAAKESGGFDNVTAFAIWEIMKAELDGVSPTLKDASSILGMLQFMFPEYTATPPPAVTFYIHVKSDVGSCEAMVSDFGKLKLAPKAESSSYETGSDFGKLKLAPKAESSSYETGSDFGKLNLAPKIESSYCDTVVNEFEKFNI